MNIIETNSGTFYNEDCITGSKKIQDNSIDLIITDPPYGIEGDKLHRHYNRDESFVTNGYIEIPAEEYARFSTNWIREAERILRPGGSIYIVSGYTNLIHILNALHNTSLDEINHIIWRYNFGVFTSRKYVSSHYHILYYTKPGGKKTFNTGCRYAMSEKDEKNGSLNYQDREDVWIINREYKPGRVKNKNELPVALLTKIIQYSSNEGDIVCDLFLGGFSTAYTAIGLNRRAIGFEISESLFEYKINKISELKPGFLLECIRVQENGSDHLTRRPWEDKEVEILKTRYNELLKSGVKQKEINQILQEELNRGYWSVEKALHQTGIKQGRNTKLRDQTGSFINGKN
jgi:site-specific DNA-methyltransferase (adenine-specific)